MPLDDAVQRVFDGDIRNASAVIGLLAAAQARVAPPRLRPADAGVSVPRRARIHSRGAVGCP